MNTRREFLRTTGLAAGTLSFSSKNIFAAEAEPAANYTVRTPFHCTNNCTWISLVQLKAAAINPSDRLAIG